VYRTMPNKDVRTGQDQHTMRTQNRRHQGQYHWSSSSCGYQILSMNELVLQVLTSQPQLSNKDYRFKNSYNRQRV
jgi:hypothetical protein